MASQEPPYELNTEQLAALAHETRQRLWAVLGSGPLSVSELARRLSVNKGNVAHHLAILERVGLVRRGQRRTVRGGTEQRFERTAQHVRASQSNRAEREITATSMAMAARELADDPDPRLHIRHLRMTARQATAVADHLDAVLESLTPARASEREYGIVVGSWRRPAE